MHHTAIKYASIDFLGLGNLWNVIIKVVLDFIIWIRSPKPHIFKATTLSLICINRIGRHNRAIKFVVFIFLVCYWVYTVMKAALETCKVRLSIFRWFFGDRDFMIDTLIYSAVVFLFVGTATLFWRRFCLVISFYRFVIFINEFVCHIWVWYTCRPWHIILLKIILLGGIIAWSKVGQITSFFVLRSNSKN